MNAKISRLGLVYVLGILLMGASCSAGKPAKAIDGGVYRSTDGGTTWVQKISVPEVGGKILGFPNADITTIAIDPNDRAAIYVGTRENGMFYSYDAGERWTAVKYFKGEVSSIAVDYFNKCKYVVVTPAKISRTADCGRTFKDILTETRPEYKLKFVLTDHFNSNVLYAATTKEIAKSLDYGDTWTNVARFKQNINSIVMDAKDSRAIYVGLAGAGVQRTLDSAKSWIDLNEALAPIDGGRNVLKIVQNVAKANSFVAITDAGLVRTDDNGTTWQLIKLLTPPKTVKILSVAVDPTNSEVIHYATASTLSKTTDGGKTWQALKPPTSREIRSIVVDPKDGKVIYLGTYLVVKK
jgi:photosystem II stability/assembly factor-like uncharacterized protein